MISNQHRISIATLNCRGLKKTTDLNKRKKFIRYLLTLQYDVLVLQETHADNPDIIAQFNMQFKTHNRPNSSHWTPHCAIIILNNKYSLQLLQDGIDNGRFILANIQLTSTVPSENDSTSNSPTTIATILGIYGRSSIHPERSAFYSTLLDISIVHRTLHNPQSPVLIMGDFNYSYENHRRPDGTLTSAPPEWLSLLDNFYVDCFQDQKQITWKTSTSSSILDFIFCSTPNHYQVSNAKQRFLSSKWTDHALLSISFQYTDQNSRGPGAWKANPFLAARRDYRSALAAHLRSHLDTFNDVQSFSTPQQSWDWVKAEVKVFTKSYQLKDNNWRKQQIKHLQKKRNLMCRLKKTRGLYFGILNTIEAQIGSLQESLAEVEILKSGKHWREKGEKSAGYLKRTATIREQQRNISELRDPDTQELCTDQARLQEIATSFYTQLFTSERIDHIALEILLRSIPSALRLTTDDHEVLTMPIDYEDILEGFKSSPRHSSPGSDGLPYEILNLIIRFPPYKELLTTVFNDALDKGVFPDTWNESIMTLLPKKGDSSDMRNYRPLSLANCDYKYFTRILNLRMMEVSKKLINSNQIGFVPGKYIAENGLRCQIIMEDAQRQNDIADQQSGTANMANDIGLLLDQEKAYDRVNLTYFQLVLKHYGFPESTIHCIYNLMALNTIKININGYFTDSIPKLRGFKQGDPLSCICYDLAFEPFLQGILTDTDFSGYTLSRHPSTITPASAQPLSTKVLAYADDALVFVHNRADLRLLRYYMGLFRRASNAKFNYNKVEAFSLSGRDTWAFWQQSLEEMLITKLTTKKDTNPIVYLGFPLIQSTVQRSTYMNTIVAKLQTATGLHATRSLSVVGKATVANTLFLSKCWYILRVTPLTQQDIHKITSVMVRFLRRGIFPVIPWSTWTLPKTQGGLGVLDVSKQYLALYFRWGQPLITTSSASVATDPLITMLIQHVQNHTRSAHHQIPLLFPTTRRTFTSTTRISSVDVLFRCIDAIPRTYDSVSIDHSTGLTLPLHAVLYKRTPSPFLVPSKMKEMTVADVFTYNVDRRFFHWKDSQDPTLRHWKYAPRKLFHGLQTGDLQLQPFFQSLCQPMDSSGPTVDPLPPVSFSPFVKQLEIFQGVDIVSKISTKTFRQACVSATVAPAHLSSITMIHWQWFWRLALTMVQRNVVYRYINHCIPHKSRLHRVYPALHPSDLCSICSSSSDSSEHFLFHCPAKASVWQAVIFEFLWPTVSIPDIIQATKTLDFYNIRYSQRREVPASVIVFITLANIWRSHFRTVFDSTPFTTTAVLAGIRLDIITRIDEEQVHKTL
jgi:endonuclease/exonuclease/phosphatase family metal-dependent hydrolase